MDLIVGLITIILVACTLKLIGVHPNDIGCFTIIVVLIGLPIIANIGNFVISLF